jgi:steroid delta-isomerase-like uncharacterized protein
MSAGDTGAVLDTWTNAWNNHDVEAVMALVADDYRRRDASFPDIDGPDGQRESVKSILSAFPDVAIEEQRRVVDGDLVSVDIVITGTQSGDFQNVPATGKRVSFRASETYRVRDAKVTEQYVVMDTLGMLQQLGVIPQLG